jgi:hypothetical protein
VNAETYRLLQQLPYIVQVLDTTAMEMVSRRDDADFGPKAIDSSDYLIAFFHLPPNQVTEWLSSIGVAEQDLLRLQRQVYRPRKNDRLSFTPWENEREFEADELAYTIPARKMLRDLVSANLKHSTDDETVLKRVTVAIFESDSDVVNQALRTVRQTFR